MKVLIADFYPKEAHRYFNCKYISAFAKVAQVTVISINGYYESEKESFIQEGIAVEDICVKQKDGRLGTRLFCIAIQNKFKKYFKSARQKYDLIFCLSYDTIAMAFAKKLAIQMPLVLCQHSNIDEYANKIKFKFARKYIYKVYHCVLEKSFKEYLVDKVGIDKKKVYFIPHPITLTDDGTTEQIKYDCVGLCNANSDEFVREIVDNRYKYEDYGLSLLIRSKTVLSESPNIIIINEYLDKEKYIQYIKQARIIFVATPSTYIYRLSGSIYDAFTLNKIVITNNKFYPELYKDLYPGICIGIKNEQEFFEKIKYLKQNEINGYGSNFKKFISDHSMDGVISAVDKLLNGIAVNGI